MSTSGLSELSLPAARSDDHLFLSRVGDEDYGHPDETSVRLSVHHDRLGEQASCGVAPIP